MNNIVNTLSILAITLLILTSCESKSSQQRKKEIKQKEIAEKQKEIDKKAETDSISYAELELQELEEAKKRKNLDKIDSLKTHGYKNDDIPELRYCVNSINEFTYLINPFKEMTVLLFENGNFVKQLKSGLKHFYSKDEVFFFWEIGQYGSGSYEMYSKSLGKITYFECPKDSLSYDEPIGLIENELIFYKDGKTSDLIFRGKSIVFGLESNGVHNYIFDLSLNKTVGKNGIEDGNYNLGPDWDVEESNELAKELLAINNYVTSLKIYQ